MRSTPTGLPKIYGVGPVITALTLGEVGDVARFADRNHFASYNGTAPDDKGSAGSPAHCVNIKGNRKLNHAIHMIAITQIRNRQQSRPRLLRPQARAVEDEEGSAPRAEAQDLRRHLPSTRRRRRNSKRAREGKRGRLSQPAWPTQPRRSALRTSHSPDPHRTLRPSPRSLDRGVPLCAFEGR